jgi:hypothetical protein
MLVAALAAIPLAVAGALAVEKSGRSLARRLVFAVAGGILGLFSAQFVAWLLALVFLASSAFLLRTVNARDHEQGARTPKR